MTVMKFKELFSNIEWKDIEESLLKNYPDASGNIASYKNVFIDLFSLEPAETNFRIYLKKVFDKDFDDEPHVEVFGKDGTLNKEIDDFKYMGERTDSVAANSEVEYALELSDWEEWLGMEIDEKTAQNYSISEIAAHCLWEMAFFGYDKTAVQEQRDALNKRVKEINSMSDEERKEQLIPWEKIKENLGNPNISHE
jgi:hypothetical protein